MRYFFAQSEYYDPFFSNLLEDEVRNVHMVRCIDCGFCGYYVDFGAGLAWREMDQFTIVYLTQIMVDWEHG